jgi:hypothetical protein
MTDDVRSKDSRRAKGLAGRPDDRRRIVDHLRALADALEKAGIPVRVGRDGEGRAFVRASHPQVPIGTDVYLAWIDGNAWFLSEWATAICPAEEVVVAVEYVVKLLGPRVSDN